MTLSLFANYLSELRMIHSKIATSIGINSHDPYNLLF